MTWSTLWLLIENVGLLAIVGPIIVVVAFNVDASRDTLVTNCFLGTTSRHGIALFIVVAIATHHFGFFKSGQDFFFFIAIVEGFCGFQSIVAAAIGISEKIGKN